MKNNWVFLICFFSLISHGQSLSNYVAVDKKAASISHKSPLEINEIVEFINTNFNTEDDKIRAIFYWVATTISYDIEAVSSTELAQLPKDRIARTLATRKGVCYDYALVFKELANKVGIKTFVIGGYTRQKTKIDRLSHAWCAAKINNEWYLFDPTWGSGYVNNNKYIRKFNNSYFKVTPSKMIVSHMPFDYLWQFTNRPISHQEFIEGKKFGNGISQDFDFMTEIINYETKSAIDKHFEAMKRIENGGIRNNLILEAYQFEKKAWTVERENEMIKKLNKIVLNFNEAIQELNDFIHYRNNKFNPTLPDEEIRLKIQSPNEKLKKCQDDVFKISSTNEENTKSINNLRKSIAESLIKSEEHLEFVVNYLSKSKLIRKTMFSKIRLN